MGKEKQNTHKFVSFNERISKLRIDVVHKIEKRTETPEESDTFVQQCLTKWSDLNCSLDFQAFRKEVGSLVKSLSLLVYHQKIVVEILQRYLEKKDSLALEALLELCVELSRDLQVDFAQYFPGFLKIIVRHLRTKDAQKIEACFKTLAYLFKFQWRHLVHDMKTMFLLYSPLLNENQPGCLHQFAAESFAFLLRKTKDLSSLLDDIFTAVVDEPGLCKGVGCLLSESVRGVRHQFHSCAQKVMGILLEKLKLDKSYKPGVDSKNKFVFQVFVHMFTEMAKYTTREHTEVIWQCLFDNVHHLLNKDDSCDEQLDLLVLLMDVWVEWKTGELIIHPLQLYKVIGSLTKKPTMSCNLRLSVLKLTSSILLADCEQLKDKILHYIFDCSLFTVADICQFSRHLNQWSSFMTSLLPKLVAHFETVLLKTTVDCEQTECILFLLAQVALERISSDNLLPHNSSAVCFNKLAANQGPHWFSVLFKLDFENVGATESDLTLLWSSLVCLPFIRPLDFQIVSVQLVKVISCLHDAAPGNQQLWFILSQAVKSLALFCLSCNCILEKTLVFDIVLSCVRAQPHNIHVLQACQVYLAVIKQQSASSEILSRENLLLVYSYLGLNLSSHEHLVRLATLKILTMFDKLIEANRNSGTQCDIFQDCLDAESIPATFTDYREKIIILQRLAYVNTQYLPTSIHNVPLRYLIGVLYVNLSTLWDPVITIISTHAIETNRKSFWSVFYNYLGHADTVQSQPSYAVTSTPNCLHGLFLHHFVLCTREREDNRVDYTNFRLLLWKAMHKFPAIVEPCSRQVVPLFLEFFSKECSVMHEDGRVTYEDITSAADISEHSRELSDDNCSSAYVEVITKIAVRPLRMKMLTACLTLLSKFKNPSCLYQEERLREIYYTLLAQRDGDIQRLALACLMTYKLGYLMPYKENLDRLLDDKTFKDELTSFGSNEELNVVSDNHRADLIKVLIRLLYGKMQRWTGVGSQGKAGSPARRSLVLRFLNNCSGDEMIVFIELVCQPFAEIVAAAAADTSPVHTLPSEIVPLRKQLGFLNMFSQLIKLLGVQAQQHLPRLLNVLLYCITASNNALHMRDNIARKHLTNVKAVRQLGVRCLTKFFSTFPLYEYQVIIASVFDLVVWPQVGRLSSESLQSPTPLLQLLHVWSENPRYFPLLSRVPPDETKGLLSHVFACLASEHVQPAVVAMVMEIADNLLTQRSPDNAHDHSDLMNFASDTSCAIANATPDGARLVLPHVATILTYLSNSVKKTSKVLAKAKGKLSKISAVSKLELSVLSKISAFEIVDEDHCVLLVRLIIPILSATHKAELQLGMLKSITSLLRNVAETKCFIAPLARLFSTLHERDARSELCNVFTSISQRCSDCLSVDQVKLLHDLNSWSVKQLDEPDFGARLDAFSALCKMVQSDCVEAKLCVPFLHNATYFAVKTCDTALRYSAVAFLRVVVKRASQDKTWFDLLVLGCILPAIKNAVKSKEEAVRNEFVLLLRDVVRKFEHVSLQDMKVLINDDPEVDFFENIVHIQVHRRIRALRKFTSICQESTFSASTLSVFILPLVTHFVYEYKSAKDHNVVTEAINTISALSLQLPWPKYSNLLRHYLRILPREKDMQKIIVRLVVSILESFHFDLTALTDSDIKDFEGNNNFNEVNESKDQGDVTTVDDDDGEAGEQNCEQTTKECQLDVQLKIHATITTRILPQLRKCLTKKTDSSDFHRLSGRKADDQDEMLRVPIVLAMVKLLQSLPKKTLQSHLPGLLLHVCQSLKSRAFEVRETARATLSNITNTLGLYYFPFILNELQASLLKGYQLHVLGSTLHYLLNKFEELVPDGGLDVSVKKIVEVLVNDIFGEPAHEREVDKIANKLPEAKSTKSFETFEIVAKKISASHLMDIVAPLKEVLDQTQNHKVCQRVEEVLRRVSVALQKNALFSPEQMLLFVYGLVTEKLPLLTSNDSIEQEDGDNTADPRLSRPDIYLLPNSRLRTGKKPEVHHKSNTHVLLSFGLQLLLTALKRQKLSPLDKKHIEMLDPFVGVLNEALNSKHGKVTTLALRSLCCVVKFPVPSLRDHLVPIANFLFKLLKNHSRSGGASGENYEMVFSAFKTITVLIRDFNELKVTERQLRILLTFVEEDINDHQRQSSAFPLLRAILSRKLQAPEINDIMLKVAELSVTDDSPTVRLQCRQVFVQFLLDYPLGKKLLRYLEFCVSQLDYEHGSGRESILELIITIITSFPEKTVYNHSGLLFLPLCMRLVNDDSANCRKLVAASIKALLTKLDVERRDNLFGIVLIWLNETMISLQRLATHVCGLFAEVETESFDRRLPDVLPLLFEIIKPEHFHKEAIVADEAVQENVSDHLLINSLVTLSKIIEQCPGVKGQITNDAWDSICNHLNFPHTWVRLLSSRLFGSLFSQVTPQELHSLSKYGQSSQYLAAHLNHKVSELCECFLSQLKDSNINEELGGQVVKNLFYLSKVMVLDSDTDKMMDHVNLQWLLDKMCNIAKYEASQTPKLSQKRLCVLRWIAAVGSHLGAQEIQPYLTQMLEPVFRELDGGSTYTCDTVHSLCQEVLELFKNLVGHEVFSHAYSQVKQGALQNREKRKVQSAFEAVANPEAHVAKKMKRNLAKKENRKRKHRS